MPLTLSVVLSTVGRLRLVILAPDESSRSCALAAIELGGRLRTQTTLSRPFTARAPVSQR